MTEIELTIDGTRRGGAVEPRTLLVHALREIFGVTGPHVGCESARCGACTVLLNGAAVKSCMVLATVAGLAPHPLQAAFQEHHALQCGYCTPGMLCAAADLLDNTPEPTGRQVREALRGNLCRCTGYAHIVDAVLAAAAEMASHD